MDLISNIVKSIRLFSILVQKNGRFFNAEPAKALLDTLDMKNKGHTDQLPEDIGPGKPDKERLVSNKIDSFQMANR